MVLLVSLVLLCSTPVHAQNERVIFDAATRVIPGENISACIDLEPGDFTVRVQAVGDRSLEPVRLSFDGYRGFDPDASIFEVVTRAATTSTVRVIGGFYCFSVFHSLPASQFDSQADITSHAQLLNLRMTIQPTS
jgi:hypothetical protein